MKEALEHDLIILATEILANEGEWNLAQLNKQAHKITEKITILTFVEKYYQTLGASEDRMYRTMRKVSDFIDDNRQEDLFDIEVEASEVQPITAPKTAAKETPKEEPATFVAMEPAPITKEEKTAPAEKPNQAEVIALGKGEKLEGIKVGDKVIFNRFSGNEIEDGEEKYLVVNAEDILAVIE